MEKYYEYLFMENLTKSIPLENKIDAVKELGKMKSYSSIPLIKSLLLNKDSGITIKLACVLTLTELGDGSFIPSFLPLQHVEDEDLLDVLIIAIGKLGLSEYVDEFEYFVNYWNINLKIEIIEALSRIGDEKSIKAMIKFYNDRDVEIKQLVKLRLKDSREFKKFTEKASEEDILNVITIVPKNKAEAMIQKLVKKTTDHNLLKIIIKAVGELKLDNGLEILSEMYSRNIDKEIRMKILESTYTIEEGRKKDFLLKKLTEETDRDIKVKIVFALGTINKDIEVERILLRLILDKKEWWMIRKVSIMVLVNVSSKSYTKELADMLNDKEEDIRVIRTIIQELGDIGDRSACEWIEKYLDTDETELKKVIILSLSKLGDRKILDKLLDDDELREKLMPESLKAIINFDDERIVDILLDVLEKRRDDMIDIVLAGLSEVRSEKVKVRLIRLVLDGNIKRETRAKAFMILANYKDDDVVQTVEKMLDRVNEWWMLKKLAVIIAGELKCYNLFRKILKFATVLDERIAKNAKEVSKKFYEEFFLKELEKENSKMYDFAKDFLRIL